MFQKSSCAVPGRGDREAAAPLESCQPVLRPDWQQPVLAPPKQLKSTEERFALDGPLPIAVEYRVEGKQCKERSQLCPRKTVNWRYGQNARQVMPVHQARGNQCSC